MNSSNTHFMRHALELAERGLYTTDPNPRVGCVIVHNGNIVGEGWHEKAGEAHAEIRALQIAGEKAKGATCYVTLEPCCHQGKTGPCSQALIKAGIKKVIIIMPDPNPLVAGKSIAQLKATGITVEVGMLDKEARKLNPGFIKRMEQGLPYVRAKIAMSLDGRSALANGISQWITSETSRKDGHRLRARSSAILTGIGTVLADNPLMNVRLSETKRQPLRVIVDSHLRIPFRARILQSPGKVMIATASKDDKKKKALEKLGVEFFYSSKDKRVDLVALLQELATRECNEIHLEAGATLLGSMLENNLVDEFVCYLAPKLLGDKARPVIHFPLLTQLEKAISLNITLVQQLESDIKITAKILKLN